MDSENKKKTNSNSLKNESFLAWPWFLFISRLFNFITTAYDVIVTSLIFMREYKFVWLNIERKRKIKTYELKFTYWKRASPNVAQFHSFPLQIFNQPIAFECIFTDTFSASVQLTWATFWKFSIESKQTLAWIFKFKQHHRDREREFRFLLVWNSIFFFHYSSQAIFLPSTFFFDLNQFLMKSNYISIFPTNRNKITIKCNLSSWMYRWNG